MKAFLIGIFSNNRSADGLAAVRESGRDDGREHATEYADGFIEGATEVLAERLKSFKAIETTAIKPSESPRIEAKPANRRKVPVK